MFLILMFGAVDSYVIKAGRANAVALLVHAC